MKSLNREDMDQTMLWCQLNLLGISKARVATHPISLALKRHSIFHFLQDFTLLDLEAINNFRYVDPVTNDLRDLNDADHILLKLLLSFYHKGSRYVGRPMDIRSTPFELFDNYRFHAYNPSAPLVPWHTKSKENDNVKAQQEKDITLWKHNIKPTFSAFPEFKDDSFYSIFKQESKLAFRMVNLKHMIDPKYVVVNQELHNAQAEWCFCMAQICWTNDVAHTILNQYKDINDFCRASTTW